MANCHAVHKVKTTSKPVRVSGPTRAEAEAAGYEYLLQLAEGELKKQGKDCKGDDCGKQHCVATIFADISFLYGTGPVERIVHDDGTASVTLTIRADDDFNVTCRCVDCP